MKASPPPHVILHSFSTIGVNMSFEMSLTQLEVKPMPRLTGAQDALSFTCAFTRAPFCPTFITANPLHDDLTADLPFQPNSPCNVFPPRYLSQYWLVLV